MDPMVAELDKLRLERLRWATMAGELKARVEARHRIVDQGAGRYADRRGLR